MPVDELEGRRAYDTGEAIAHVWQVIEVILESDLLEIGDLAAVVEEAERSYMSERGEPRAALGAGAARGSASPRLAGTGEPQNRELREQGDPA